MSSPDCSSEAVFCAALVTDTLGLDDHGMNQDTWAGLEAAKAQGLVDQIEYIESIDSRDYQKNIAYFADQKFDLIITVNEGMSDETLLAADLYPFDPTQGKPDSPQGAVPVFVGMNQSQAEPPENLIPITFAEDQMGYAAGVLAAKLSQTGIIGAVCETSGIDAMWRYCEGFRVGAESINPEIKSLVFYRDNGDREKLFIDEAWGYDTAMQIIQDGADVIFAAGGATGQGALRAAAETDILAIGAERDQAAVLAELSPSVVTCVMGQASFEVQEVMRMVREGNAPEARFGQIGTAPFNQKFPESLQIEMKLLMIRLWSGEIRTNVAPEKP